MGKYIQLPNGKLAGSTPGGGGGGFTTRDRDDFDGRPEFSRGGIVSAAGRAVGSGRVVQSSIEKEAVGIYASGETFFELRDSFRNGKSYELSDGSNAFTVLDGIAKQTSLKNDTTLYRSMRLGPGNVERLEVGNIIKHDFYMSTTQELGSAKSYGKASGRKKKGEKDIIITILAPAGSSVIPGHDELGEIVFARGSELEIRRVTELSDGTLSVLAGMREVKK